MTSVKDVWTPDRGRRTIPMSTHMQDDLIERLKRAYLNGAITVEALERDVEAILAAGSP